MKFNKWTVALAAVGAISLASAVRADEKLVPLNTAVSSTVISGYVDVAGQYNIGNNGPNAGVPIGLSNSKIDTITLNSFDVALDKPEDETPWAAGYHAELNTGINAVGVSLASQSSGYNTALRQAYVALRTPVGNGIDWKVGAQDDVIGYEGNTDGGNPNYTRSIGYAIEPTTLVGVVGTYKVIDAISVQAGLADAINQTTAWRYNGENNSSSDKTFVGTVAFTAPDSFGWAKGATLNLGTLLSIDKGGQDNYFAGLTLPTPISMLKVGAAFDLVSVNNAAKANPNNDSGWVGGLYAIVAPTDKLSFNVRGEYYDLTGSEAGIATGSNLSNYVVGGANGRGEELTATVSYNLWANVISRVEFRWDHNDEGGAFSNSDKNSDAFMLAANFIYTF